MTQEDLFKHADQSRHESVEGFDGQVLLGRGIEKEVQIRFQPLIGRPVADQDRYLWQGLQDQRDIRFVVVGDLAAAEEPDQILEESGVAVGQHFQGLFAALAKERQPGGTVFQLPQGYPSACRRHSSAIQDIIQQRHHHPGMDVDVRGDGAVAVDGERLAKAPDAQAAVFESTAQASRCSGQVDAGNPGFEFLQGLFELLFLEGLLTGAVVIALNHRFIQVGTIPQWLLALEYGCGKCETGGLVAFAAVGFVEQLEDLHGIAGAWHGAVSFPILYIVEDYAGMS